VTVQLDSTDSSPNFSKFHPDGLVHFSWRTRGERDKNSDYQLAYMILGKITISENFPSKLAMWFRLKGKIFSLPDMQVSKLEFSLVCASSSKRSLHSGNTGKHHFLTFPHYPHLNQAKRIDFEKFSCRGTFHRDRNPTARLHSHRQNFFDKIYFMICEKLQVYRDIIIFDAYIRRVVSEMTDCRMVVALTGLPSMRLKSSGRLVCDKAACERLSNISIRVRDIPSRTF
jgi:hypothetical protein